MLETLTQYQARATFFCIGDNVRKHPSVFQQLIDNKHSVGNHTFNHKNGWKTKTSEYLANFHECSQQLNLETNLFRPPYGRIRKEQAAQLPENTKVIMWDVLSGDFSKDIHPEVCLKKSIRHTRPGSIILFHDSIKAFPNLSYTLPRYLQHFSELGYRFEALPMNQQIKN